MIFKVLSGWQADMKPNNNLILALQVTLQVSEKIDEINFQFIMNDLRNCVHTGTSQIYHNPKLQFERRSKTCKAFALIRFLNRQL